MTWQELQYNYIPHVYKKINSKTDSWSINLSKKLNNKFEQSRAAPGQDQMVAHIYTYYYVVILFLEKGSYKGIPKVLRYVLLNSNVCF